MKRTLTSNTLTSRKKTATQLEDFFYNNDQLPCNFRFFLQVAVRKYQQQVHLSENVPVELLTLMADYLYSPITNQDLYYTVQLMVKLYLAPTIFGDVQKERMKRFGTMNGWDTSKVTCMAWLFLNTDSSKVNINAWETGNVTNMQGMFATSGFNSSLQSWDVSNVRSMDFMFHRANSFNQSLSNWNVQKVKNFQFMFTGALEFNNSLDEWVLHPDASVEAMFSNSPVFHRSLPWLANHLRQWMQRNPQLARKQCLTMFQRARNEHALPWLSIDPTDQELAPLFAEASPEEKSSMKIHVNLYTSDILRLFFDRYAKGENPVMRDLQYANLVARSLQL